MSNKKAHGMRNNQSQSKTVEQRDIDRRDFVQKMMATVPALGMACALPSFVSGGEKGKNPQWVCRVDVVLMAKDYWIYLYRNCVTNDTYLEAGPPELTDFGDCSAPTEGGCFELEWIETLENTNDELNVYFSPKLSKEGRDEFEKFHMLMLYNIRYPKS